MLFLLVSVLAAAPVQRLEYERKCLYCHSEEVTEGHKQTEAQWKRTIERMRRKAPLLISRGDVTRLTLFMTQSLNLGLQPVRPTPFPPKAAPVPEPVAPPPAAELKPPPAAPLLPDAEPPPAEVSAEAAELEQQALALMQRRCSKCHTLGRIYARLDTLERSLTTLERMRLKTGSGITDHDFRLLEDYLRTQF